MFLYCISLGNIDVAKKVALHWVHVQPVLYGELLLCFLEGALLFIHFFLCKLKLASFIQLPLLDFFSQTVRRNT